MSAMSFSVFLQSQTETISEVEELMSQAAAETDALSRTEVLLSAIYQKLCDLGSSLLAAIVVGLIGWYFIKFVIKICNRLFGRSKLETAVVDFLMSIIRVILRITLIIIVATTMGIEMTSFVALLTSAGLAISLSLQGCLTNFAGGVLILITKPFEVGDYISDGKGTEGIVTAIDIIYTRLLTADNQAVVIPNGTLANSTITNATKEPVRRLDFQVSIDYDEDIEKARTVLEEVGHANEYVLQDKEIRAYVNKFDPSSIDMTLRVWVSTKNLWNLKYQMIEQIKLAFNAYHIVIPYDKLDVNVTSGN